MVRRKRMLLIGRGKLQFVELDWLGVDKSGLGLGTDVGTLVACRCRDSAGWFTSRYDALTPRVFNFSRALCSSTFHRKRRRAAASVADFPNAR